MNIYEKLQQARVKLQESKLKKSGFNKFANFDYFELKDFLPKINEIFLELKLFSKFDLFEDKGVLTIINSENPEEKESFSTPKTELEMKGQNGLQQIGSTHTYLKRYCYYNALEIIINDETEATIDKNKSNQKQQKKTSKELSEKEIRDKAIEYISKNQRKYIDLINIILAENEVDNITELELNILRELANNILKQNKTKKGA